MPTSIVEFGKKYVQGKYIDNLRTRNVWPYNQSETVVVMADKRVTEAEGD